MPSCVCAGALDQWMCWGDGELYCCRLVCVCRCPGCAGERTEPQQRPCAGEPCLPQNPGPGPLLQGGWFFFFCVQRPCHQILSPNVAANPDIRWRPAVPQSLVAWSTLFSHVDDACLCTWGRPGGCVLRFDLWVHGAGLEDVV